MLCIKSASHDPYFNIACEEYLLKHRTDEFFMLYRNQPSVVVGKHQNALAEIDPDIVKEKGIKVVRRLSGGGAVYHDLGNLNFTFIKNGKEGKMVDFKGYTEPIIAALAKIGLEAKFEGHNNLTINGLKISGNAEHVFKSRVMHHGTLLFQSNLHLLAQLLYVDKNRYSDRAVQSVLATVTNISDHLPQPMTIDDFAQHLWEHILTVFAYATEYSLSAEDKGHINKLYEEKYTRWEWNYGYSPTYSLQRKIELPSGAITIALDVDNGNISNVMITGSSFPRYVAQSIEEALMGRRHETDVLARALAGIPLDDEQRNTIVDGIL